LNGFLRSNTILGVDRRWVDQGPMSFWTFLFPAQVVKMRDPFNPQPKAQAFRGCMRHIMHACAFGCGLNGCMRRIMHACACGCGLNE
jgi:hypothetical protein